MGTLTDAIRRTGRQDAMPSEDGAGVGQISERERAVINRYKSSFGNGQLSQEIAEGRAKREIAARQQQRAYAEQAPPEVSKPVKEMLSNLDDRTKVRSIYQKLTPEQRQEALNLVPGISQQLGDDRGGALSRIGGALRRGVSTISQPAVELADKVIGTDWGGTPEEIEFIRQMEAAKAQEFAPALPSDPWYERFPLQALEMVPFSAATIGGGAVGGAVGKAGGNVLARGAAAGVPGARGVAQAAGAVGRIPTAVGLPAMTAQGVGTVAGITAVGFPGQYAQEIDQLKELGVEDGPGMQALAVGTALASSALEAIMPNPFKSVLPAGKVAIQDGALKAARQYLWEAVKRAPPEMTEEYAQGLVSGLGKTVASYLDMTTKDVTLGDAFATSFEQGNAAIGPMAFLLGVPALAGAGAVGFRARAGTPPGPPPVTQAPPVQPPVVAPGGIPPAGTLPEVTPPVDQTAVVPPTTVPNQVVPQDQSQRLAQLQASLVNGQVSRTNGRKVGITHPEQKVRTALVIAEIEKLGGIVPPVQPSPPQGVPDASQVRTNEARNDAQGDGGEGSQVDSGSQVRIEGQVEEGSQPTSEVAPAQEVPVTSDPWANVSDWIADNLRPLADAAEKSGLANKIEELAAQRKVAKQIATELGVDQEIVDAVRIQRGIPSWTNATNLGGAAVESQEFTEWRNKRQTGSTSSDVSQPPVTPAPQQTEATTTNESLSDQEITAREYAQNFNEVTGDPKGARSRNLHRAIGYAKQTQASFDRKLSRGEITQQQRDDMVNSLDGEIHMMKTILKDRGDYSGGGPYSDESGFDSAGIAIPKEKPEPKKRKGKTAEPGQKPRPQDKPTGEQDTGTSRGQSGEQVGNKPKAGVPTTMTELLSKGGLKLPENAVTQKPDGQWGFSGKVSGSLKYETESGGVPTDEDFAAIKEKASFGERFARDEAKKRGLRVRSFESKEAAEKALAELLAPTTTAEQKKGGKPKPNRQQFTDTIVQSGIIRKEDVGKKSYAFTFRDRMPLNRWLAANEISDKLGGKDARGWVAKSLRPMVDAGLITQMFRPDGTPVYAWDGTEPTGELVTAEQFDKSEKPDRVQQIQNAFPLSREQAIVADILADATSPPGEVEIALPGTPIPWDAVTQISKASAKMKAEGKAYSSESAFFEMWDKFLRAVGGKRLSLKSTRKAVEEAVEDIASWIEANPQYLDYYAKDMQAERDSLVEIHPELRDDANWALFKVISGIASNNAQLAGNVNEQINAYSSYAKDGRIDATAERSETGRGEWRVGKVGFTLYGGAQGVKALHYQTLNTIIKQQGGAEGAVVWLMGRVKSTPSGMKAARQSVGLGPMNGTNIAGIKATVEAATGQSDEVPRAFAIFGPKVGAYVLNHLGQSEYTTVDVWESRFWRSFFKDVSPSTGLEEDTETRAAFIRAANAFAEMLGLSPSAAQAARWFYVIQKMNEAGYTYAREKDRVSVYTAREVAKRQDTQGANAGRKRKTAKPKAGRRSSALRSLLGDTIFGEEVAPDTLHQKQRDPQGDIQAWTHFVNASKAIIGATDKADVSSFFHEWAHPLRKFLFNREVSKEDRGEITDDDIQKIEDFVGVKDGNWTRENEEGFVDALMSYWMEGKAPTPELETVFQKISAWLSKVFSVIQRKVELNDEVRAIFDKVHRRGGVDPKKRQALKEAEVSAESHVEPTPTEAVDESLDDFFDDIAPSEERVDAIGKLEAAGIKIKQTKKGWSLTGLPDNLSQEIHDGIKAEGGRRTGYGYLFKDNPTNRLVPTAEAITDAIRQADEAAAMGMVSTPIGIYSPEDAEWYRETRKQRLELAKQQLNEENAAVDELLSQFVGNRGVFKKQLLEAAENSDPNSIEGFGKLLEYSVDHSELGLPQTEDGLFRRLLKTVVQEKDLEKQIDEELAAELAAEEGDDSFDFGDEQEPAQPQQTAIEGLEEDVARQERKETHEAKRAKLREQMATGESKGKQKTFLTDIYGAPDQGTLFDTDGIAEESDGDTLFQATESPERLAARMLRSAIDAGAKTFAGYIAHAKKQGLRDDQILGNASTMELTWDRLRARDGFKHLPEAGKVAAILSEKAEPVATEKPKGQPEQKQKQPEKPAEKPKEPPTGGFVPRVPGVRNEAEPEPYEPHKYTGMAKAVMNDLRELAGIPELGAGPPESTEQWALDAQSTMAADPHAATRLLNDIIANPARALDQHDVMLLAFRYRALVNEAEPHFQEVVDANASGDAERIAKARTNYIIARQPVTEFEELTLKAKATWGRTGVALQILLRRDNTVAGLLRRAREANHGKPLNEKQEIEMRDLAKRFADIQKKLDEALARADKAEAEVASLRHLKELVKESPTRKRPSKEQKSELDKSWADIAKLANVDLLFQRDATNPFHNNVQMYRDLGVETFSELRKHVQERLGKEQAAKLEDKFKEAWEATKPETEVPANIDRGNLAQLTREARRIERSIVEGLLLDHSKEAVIEMRDEIVNAVHAEMQELLDESFTHRQTMDALSGYGQFSRPSQDTTDTLLRNLNAEVLKLRQIDQLGDAVARTEQLRAEGKEDAEIADTLIKEGLLVAQTGLVRDTPTDRLRDLNRKYNELKKDIPASSEGRAGLLQTAIAAIERGLTNRIRDLNHALSQTPPEPIKIGRKPSPTNENIERLREERDALLKEYRKLFPAEKKKLTPEQRLANAIKAAERSIEVLEKQIATRNFDKQEQEALPESSELTELRERLEHLRDQRNVAKALELSQWESEGGAVGPDPKEAAYRKAYIASLSNRIAKLQQFLREGDFSPQQKKLPRILSKEELDLKTQLAELNTEKLKKMADYHLKNLKGIAWTADKISEVLHLARAVETMADLSALGRQGGLIAMGRPALAKNALVGVIKSMAQAFDKSAIFNKQDLKLSELEQFLTGIDSRKAELAFMHQLTEGEDAEFRILAGLDLPSTDQAITRQEEVFQGRWGKYFPGVAISSRLYTMILNKMRADMFDLMVEKLGRQGKPTLEEAKLIASFVNVMTGRSDLKQFNSHAATLNNVFFAPRYVASRFQYLAMPFYLPFKGGVKANWQIKRAIYREYARTASGAMLTLGLISMAGYLFWDDDDEDKPTVGFDPTTSDFLKPKFGETRLDFLAGLQQVFVLSARMLPEELGGGRIGDKKYGEGGPYAQSRATVIARFLRTKLAPGPGYVVTGLNDWENVIGEKADRVFGLKVHPAIGTTTNLFFPLSMQSVADAFETQPVPVAAGASILSILGVGMSTYGPKTEYMTGTPEERQKQITDDLESLEWDAPDPSYSEFLTKEQLDQFEQRRANRVGLKLSQAISDPESELGKKTRDKALELIKESKLGRTRAEAIKAYIAYWQENNGKNGRKASTHEIVDGSRVMKAALRKGINKVKALYRD